MPDSRKYSDRRSYLIAAVKKRRKAVRAKAVDYLGGACRRCGYRRCPEALDIHHLAPSRKEFGISSKGYTRSWERVRKELDQCVLLCANCHRELHAGLATTAGLAGGPPGARIAPDPR